MASERMKITLGELGRVVTGKTPLTSIADNFGGDVPFVTPSDMDGRKTISSTLRSLTEKGATSVKGSRIPAGAVMVSCIGSDMGKAAVAGRECVTNQQINSIVVADKFCCEYVYYDLSTRKAELQHIASGAAQPILNKGHFSGVKISLPPLSEQKRIANILGTLDDKIELNRRMNATLEEMARALYQSWFVDFDPVKRNAEGGAQRPEDFLFPNSFDDAAVGDIPRGWTVEPVGDVVDCVGGGTPSTKEPKFWDNGVHHWTTPKDFSSLQSPILLDTSRKLTNAGIAKISSGLLPAGTLLLSSRAPVGYLAISAIPVAINQGFIAMKCNDRASNYFMLNWCQANMGEIKSRATGTTFPEISKNSFRPISVVLPPKGTMAEFTNKVAPLYAQITANLQQSRILAHLRDALIPHLLSGESCVR